MELTETESQYEKPRELGFGPAEQKLGKTLPAGGLPLPEQKPWSRAAYPARGTPCGIFTEYLTTKCKNCRWAYYKTLVPSLEKVFLPYLRIDVFSYPVLGLPTRSFDLDHLPPARSQWCFIDLSGFCLGYPLLSCVWLSVWYWQGPVSTR